ncbi:MAG: type II toxin-antitoxin system prevent-host-death family antitoxin [Thermoflexales bacterium]|nr:type II toxin-antitoxin system prevent-host-death family antitoxin [Thermoflexales bacterium]
MSRLIHQATAGRERIVLTSRGHPRAALISIEDLELLERMEEEREALMLAQAVSTEARFYSIAEVEAELARLETEES